MSVRTNKSCAAWYASKRLTDGACLNSGSLSLFSPWSQIGCPCISQTYSSCHSAEFLRFQKPMDKIDTSSHLQRTWCNRTKVCCSQVLLQNLQELSKHKLIYFVALIWTSARQIMPLSSMTVNIIMRICCMLYSFPILPVPAILLHKNKFNTT